MGGARKEQTRIVDGVLVIDAEVFSGSSGRWMHHHEEVRIDLIELAYESKGREFYSILKEKGTDRVVWRFQGGSGHNNIYVRVKEILEERAKVDPPHKSTEK